MRSDTCAQTMVSCAKYKVQREYYLLKKYSWKLNPTYSKQSLCMSTPSRHFTCPSLYVRLCLSASACPSQLVRLYLSISTCQRPYLPGNTCQSHYLPNTQPASPTSSQTLNLQIPLPAKHPTCKSHHLPNTKPASPTTGQTLNLQVPLPAI